MTLVCGSTDGDWTANPPVKAAEGVSDLVHEQRLACKTTKTNPTTWWDFAYSLIELTIASMSLLRD